MITTQMYKINEEIYLNDLCLEENKEMMIWVEKSKDTHEFIWLKIANVNGKLAIFVQDIEDAVVNEWQGQIAYKKVISRIEYEQAEKGEID